MRNLYKGRPRGLPLYFLMKNLDTIVTIAGIIYGVWLILIVFVRNKFTEAFRLDVMFMPNSSESTRPLNLVVGVLVAGYSIYSLLKG